MPTATLIALTQMTMNGARCQALFSSGLQPSDTPTADMVATAISRAVQQFGAGGCAGRMAQEFGDHPDAAARRMRWVRQLIAQEPAAHRPQAGHERDLRPVRTCGPGGLPRVPAWPALPGLPYQRAFPAGTHARFVDQMIHEEKEKEKRSRQVTQLSTSRIPGGFTEKTVRVNGVMLNYATGGTGPAVVLVHGYPQTWYMWRKVMPALAEQYTVIAPDLRGSGGSDAPATGYDKASLAEDIHQLLLALGHAGEVSLVGHDIGGTVSYAYAAAHRDSIRRLTVIEAPQIDESLYQFPSVTPAGPGFWNFGFFMLGNGLPERMVSGREDTWIAGFVDWLEVVKGAVDPDAVAEYAAHLRRPGHLGASYAYFRAFHGDAEATIRHRETPLAMPVLAIGGDGALGQAIPDQMQLYASDVTGAVFPCGHWVAEESPELLLKHLLPFLSQRTRRLPAA